MPPTLPQYACPRCRRLVAYGQTCRRCASAYEQARGTSTARGYGAPWRRFRRLYTSLCVEAGLPPTCGTSLPTGPNTAAFSLCAKAGLLTFTSSGGHALHLDHEPPLQPHERGDEATVCDPNRVGWLCDHCHAAKENAERTTTYREPTDAR